MSISSLHYSQATTHSSRGRSILLLWLLCFKVDRLHFTHQNPFTTEIIVLYFIYFWILGRTTILLPPSPKHTSPTANEDTRRITRHTTAGQHEDDTNRRARWRGCATDGQDNNAQGVGKTKRQCARRTGKTTTTRKARRTGKQDNDAR